jgi:hypothetical protein
MSEITIREVAGEEMIEAAYWLANYAFGPSPPFRDKDEWRELASRRRGVSFLAAFVEDDARAVLGSATLVQHVRDALFPMGGVFGVASHPLSRRRGYVRRLMTRLFEDYRQQGRPFSCLYPFRESFYQRLGYVTFPHPRTAVFDPAALAPLLEQDLGGELALLRLNEGYGAYRAFLRRVQPHIHGFALFEEDEPERFKEGKEWLVLARVDDEVVGALLYRMEGDFIPFTMDVFRFYYTTARGRYLLLSWLARHIDHAGKVELRLPALDMPKTWWPDLKPEIKLPFLAPQGRVIDVAGIGGMATGPGAFTVRVSDPFCPWNDGVWSFETVDGHLQVRPGGEAEGEITIHALAALAYGTNDPAEFPFRGWGEPDPALQEVMRTIFPREIPHLHETY